MKLLTMSEAEYERLGRYEADASDPLFAEIAARGQLVYELSTVLRRLVDVMPKCDVCNAPATRAFRSGDRRWCDACAEAAFDPAEGEDRPPSCPRAAPLREAIALLNERKER